MEDDTWPRIERWLAEHVAGGAPFPGPASPENTRSVEAELGRRLPADLRASLERHDGGDAAVFDAWTLLALARSRRVREQLCAAETAGSPVIPNTLAVSLGVEAGAGADIVATLAQALVHHLGRHDVAQLPGLGELRVSHRRGFEGTDPSTGERISAPAARILGFRAGAAMRAALEGRRFQEEAQIPPWVTAAAPNPSDSVGIVGP